MKRNYRLASTIACIWYVSISFSFYLEVNDRLDMPFLIFLLIEDTLRFN